LVVRWWRWSGHVLGISWKSTHASILEAGGIMSINAAVLTPNTALQTDKDKLSCISHSQKPRQLAFAAELGR
jgi:hypothetical protein